MRRVAWPGLERISSAVDDVERTEATAAAEDVASSRHRALGSKPKSLRVVVER